MLNRCFIITGTSRGIGEALAKLLLEDDHYVFGISRGRSESLSGYKKYFHKNYDLSNLEEIEDMLREILTQFPFKEAEMICLINNAAMLEPLKPIQHCKTSEITKNLQISLIAPMILSSCFIRITNELKNRKKIINISSGSGAYPSPSMSIYSTAKAGINMFTRCIGLE